MIIWVDADGAPQAIKELVLRASERRRVEVVLVANRWIPKPKSRLVRTIQVGAGLDVADDYIAANCKPGDLVVTSDIPLAADVVDRGAEVLEFRGEMLTTENIRQRLSMRDFMDDLRANGVTTGGPAPLGPVDKQRFANALDRWLTVALKGREG